MKLFIISICKNYYGSVFFIFLCLSLFAGFLLNEDASGGGNSSDFYLTLPYVEELKKNIFSISTKWTVHFPLHYIILSKLSILAINEKTLRFYFTCISILIPILFYNCTKIKFDKKNSNLLLALTSVIFVIPAFRYSAIWANAQNTAFFFFLISIYFFFKWEKKKINSIDINIILHLTAFFLSVYSRQYFLFFIFYFLFIYSQRLTWKNNLIIYIVLFIFSLPGFILVLYNNTFLSGTGLSFKFYNSFLVNFSIISFYLIPIFFINFFFDQSKHADIKKNYIYLPIIFLIIFFLAFFFDYNYHLGGGFFLKSSRIMLNNNLFFYFTSLLGLFFIYIIAKENIINFITIMLLVFCFSGNVIYQKYFEPLFFIFFFLFLDTKYYEIFFLKLKAILGLLTYYSIYLLLGILNNLYKITKNIL